MRKLPHLPVKKGAIMEFILVSLFVLAPLDVWLWTRLYKLKIKEYEVSLADGYKAWRREHTKDYILTKVIVAVAAILVFIIVASVCLPFMGGASTIPALVIMSLTKAAYRTVTNAAREEVELRELEKEPAKKSAAKKAEKREERYADES